jgi:hypothetical protein
MRREADLKVGPSIVRLRVHNGVGFRRCYPEARTQGPCQHDSSIAPSLPDALRRRLAGTPARPLMPADLW